MQRSGKEKISRVVILMAGLAIAHFGVTLFLLADLGADPFNVLIQGLYRTLRKSMAFSWLTHGNVHICVNLLIILVLLLVDLQYIRLGTLLCMVCGGPIIDMFTLLLQPFLAAEPSMWVRGMMMAVGCVILAFGMTLVIKSDAGTGPNDLVAVVISERWKFKFSIVRVFVDFFFVASGYLLGGKFGAGTIVCAFLVGPVAGFFLPRSERLVQRFLRRI